MQNVLIKRYNDEQIEAVRRSPVADLPGDLFHNCCKRRNSNKRSLASLNTTTTNVAKSHWTMLHYQMYITAGISRPSHGGNNLSSELKARKRYDLSRPYAQSIS